MSLHDQPPDELSRLEAEWYRGKAWVHWTMTIDKRQRGWLDKDLHAALREILIHTCGRYSLLCPAYCLMPDHAHFLFMGLGDQSDQFLAVRFLRKFWNQLLKNSDRTLQKQAYDHVLNESARNPSAFEDTLLYILKNAERAKLVTDWDDWPFLGAIACGYPILEPRDGFQRYTESMWNIHNRETTRLSGM